MPAEFEQYPHLTPEDYQVIDRYAVPELVNSGEQPYYNFFHWRLILHHFIDAQGQDWVDETSDAVYSPEEVLALARQVNTPHAA